MSKGKGKKQGDFFKSANLKMDREIQEERKKAGALKTGNKGFIAEIKRTREVSPKYWDTVKKAQEKTQYQGEQIIKNKDVEELQIDVNPKKNPQGNGDSGFVNSVRFKHWVKDQK